VKNINFQNTIESSKKEAKNVDKYIIYNISINQCLGVIPRCYMY